MKNSTGIKEILEQKFAQNVENLSEEVIAYMAKTNQSIQNVIERKNKEAYGLITYEEPHKKVSYTLVYVCRFKEDLKGVAIKLTPDEEHRNFFVYVFSDMIEFNFQVSKKQDIFNTFQQAQCELFDKCQLVPYDDELLNSFKSMNAEIFIPKDHELIYVPAYNKVINSKKNLNT